MNRFFVLNKFFGHDSTVPIRPDVTNGWQRVKHKKYLP